MGFETPSRLHLHKQMHNLNFVPMGFETSGSMVVCCVGVYLNFVPMGFETHHRLGTDISAHGFELCPYGI